MNPCIRLRIMARRRWRRVRRFFREVRDDIQYRHIWHKVQTPAGIRFYRCPACGAESVSPEGGHLDRCPAREVRRAKATA